MQERHQKILLLRFSSLGDAAMTIPVIQQLRAQQPGLLLTVVSRKAFKPLFDAAGISFIEADLDGRHQGLLGLYRLCRTLKSQRFDAVADLHGVLRSHLISAYFRLFGTPVRRIRKGRAAKASLTRKRDKRLRPLKSTFQRYAEVFQALGLAVTLDPRRQNFLGLPKHPIAAIGIAPFATYREKCYPLARMKRLIQTYLAHSDHSVYLFGGGSAERRALDQLATLSPRVENAAHLDLGRQLALMARLRVLLSMDSANMHLASLVGTPVVSLWLATHPHAGFLGYGQPPTQALQRTDLDCRPCSVFGDKKCWRGDHACQQLDQQLVLEALLRF